MAGLKKLAPDAEILPFIPELPLFLAVLQRATLFISGDTGPLHFAAALGVPTISLFGPSPASALGTPWRKASGVDWWHMQLRRQISRLSRRRTLPCGNFAGTGVRPRSRGLLVRAEVCYRHPVRGRGAQTVRLPVIPHSKIRRIFHQIVVFLFPPVWETINP